MAGTGGLAGCGKRFAYAIVSVCVCQCDIDCGVWRWTGSAFRPVTSSSLLSRKKTLITDYALESSVGGVGVVVCLVEEGSCGSDG